VGSKHLHAVRLLLGKRASRLKVRWSGRRSPGGPCLKWKPIGPR